MCIKFKRSRLTWEKVEELKMEHCYISEDYVSESRLFQVNTISFHPHDLLIFNFYHSNLQTLNIVSFTFR